eukprot:CAMPEP_0119355014 /NCGR_PEP_ID=MMETSP1334-20130426/3942_1 /TAXON_ID=127549 /ORGANISM="Calcidiscus leptoporus, Strain RCC1130" /LENGTH=1106 /DNA_ID=CAMNT_0007368737 /DNA_START=103 /DNA_END=3423 /DNA_ORIENTATION=+
MAAAPTLTAPTPPGPSSMHAAVDHACAEHRCNVLNIFLRHPTTRALQCVRCSEGTPVLAFWERFVSPLLGVRHHAAAVPQHARLMCAGRTLHVSQDVSLADCGVGQLATIELAAQLPSQGFSRMHQLLEHLVETLTPVSCNGSTTPSPDEPPPLSAREPIMHAVEAEISEIRSEIRIRADTACCCLSCTRKPNSTLWLCGVLLHSTDAAIVNLAYRVVQLLLRARADCAAPVTFFNEQSGALTLNGEESRFGWLHHLVHEALTPEGVAIASLLTLRQAYDAKTHPLLWQHPHKKQTLLELAARSHWPCLLQSLLPALDLSRLASSGALSAVSMASYKAVMSMALNGRHELLSLLLQTGITSAQHVLLLLETVLQKKGKLPMIERVAAEMVRYIGPLGSEACSVLKVAAGHSSAAVVALLLDLCHYDKRAFDLELVGVALAEACDCDNEETMQLLLSRWSGRCSSTQAQGLLRAFAARGDAVTVERLLSRGSTAMVQMDNQQRARLASCGLAHAAGDGAQRTQVLKTLLQAGADPKSEHGETALRNAARDGLSQAMKLLLGKGTNVNAVDEEGKTVLCVAACSGCCETVRTLLEHGAQVRMRCPDGREPLDFAADEAVKQLLLVEVEKLRMGLLDELLADEGDGGGKSGKGKAKKAKKAKAAAAAAGGGSGGGGTALPSDANVEAAVAATRNGSSEGKVGGAAAEAALAASKEAAAHEEVAPPSGKSKKKKKGKGGSGGGVAAAPASSDATPNADLSAALAVDAASETARQVASETATELADSGEAAPPSPSKGKVKEAEEAVRAAEGAAVQDGSSSLLDAAVHVLSGQSAGLSMRISSLISALYDRSATFKEEIKSAGGAKLWLSEHSDAFVLDCDCHPGHESVKLRSPSIASAAVANNRAEQPRGRHKPAAAPAAVGGGPPAIGGGNAGTNGSVRLPSVGATGEGAWHGGSMPRLPEEDLGLLGEDIDPMGIERKIRGVQKKLRRVQQIEEQAANGQVLDAGQQALRSSKLSLQSSLQQLLQQWAVLEPVLIEQQAQKMLAIADSECAVCLDEYDAERPAIRTSCCGYHFHKLCLLQCIQSKSHCPICFADQASCKVVEQRVRST